jgi:hypothetical protein
MEKALYEWSLYCGYPSIAFEFREHGTKLRVVFPHELQRVPQSFVLSQQRQNNLRRVLSFVGLLSEESVNLFQVV